MDFSFSETQEMLRKAARDFLEKECPKSLVREMEEDERGYSPELWRKMANLDWMALPFPKQYDGGEGSFLDLVILFEEMGRACLPSPFLPTVVLAGLTILDVGSKAQKEKFLPRIARGDMIATLALTEPSDIHETSGITCRAVIDGNGYLLSGTKLFVSDAAIADYLVVAACTKDTGRRERGITLFLVDAKSPGISYVPLDTIAADKQFEVCFDCVKLPRDAVLGRVDNGWDQVKRILERAAVTKCAEMVGGAQKVLEMTVDYAKTRIQFDHPIGSFQAIQHYCASMATDVDGARVDTYRAAWLISQGLPCAKEAAIAKAWVGEAYRRVTALSHQIHGTIAFTKDFDLELYIRRAKAAEIAFGGIDFHRETIAREIGL